MAERQLALPSLGARLRGTARGLGLADFWQWWRAQLDPLMPQSLRTAVARRRMRPVVVFGGDHATLWRPAVEAGLPVMRPVATVPLATDPATHAAEGRAALAQGREGSGAPSVVVSLSAADVLRRRLTLPAALEENLRQALAYDLDRHTPFRPDELYFDAAVVDRAPARGTIAVDLATARRAAVDPLLRHVAAWGGEVVAVVPESPATSYRSRLNLLPPDARTTRALLRRWQFWVPFALVVTALLAAIVIPIWQKRAEAIDLGHQADAARARAAVSETLRAEVNAKVSDYNFALGRKYMFPSAIAVVDTVSKLLPDDTWLTQFEIKTLPKGKDTQREIMLRGETANAGKLVQVLEESQMFTQAAQRGPTTKIQPGPGEIFDLGAQLRVRPAPPPLTVAVGASSPPGTAPAPGTPAPGSSPSGNVSPASPPAGGPSGAPPVAPAQPSSPTASSGAPPAARTTPAPAPSATAPATSPAPGGAPPYNEARPTPSMTGASPGTAPSTPPPAASAAPAASASPPSAPAGGATVSAPAPGASAPPPAPMAGGGGAAVSPPGTLRREARP